MGALVVAEVRTEVVVAGSTLAAALVVVVIMGLLDSASGRATGALANAGDVCGGAPQSGSVDSGS
jgi:hypothetical protein